ncbi:tRNA-dihydrouridine synthase family protein [Candidatus Saccharibacteria bacterium oral taxon 488]|nr:tRNA-dihydrouridine synthase family protein [Candidatus Saccharibacteria bacterium oral taxon 488]
MTCWDNLPQPFFILAPMEAVTDVVFRHVVKQAGAPDVFFTEFANATGWVHAGDKAIAGRLVKTDDEYPLVAQIWGGEPGDMEQFASYCAKLGFDGIDINMGCPAKSATKSGGAALIRRPDVAVAAITAAKTAGLPVSVKTRLGYSRVDEWKEWLGTLLAHDLANLTIHLRTKKEMSKVPAHYELIDDIIALRDDIAPQTLLTINGDIRNRAHGLELVRQHPGINGIMIGRGVFSDPFCFACTDARTSHKIIRDPLKPAQIFSEMPLAPDAPAPTTRSRQISSGDLSEKCASNQNDAPFTNALEHKSELIVLLYYHLDLFDHYQPTLGRPYETLKRFFKIYIRDFDGAKELRDQLMHTTSTDEVRKIFEKYKYYDIM